MFPTVSAWARPTRPCVVSAHSQKQPYMFNMSEEHLAEHAKNANQNEVPSK